MTIDTQEALRLLGGMIDCACAMDAAHQGDEWSAEFLQHRKLSEELRALLSAKEGEPSAARELFAERDGFTAMGRKPFTYEHQPTNDGAWRLGEACLKAQPGGDLIDRGLSLLQQLQIRGYGVVPVAALRDAEKEKGNE